MMWRLWVCSLCKQLRRWCGRCWTKSKEWPLTRTSAGLRKTVPTLATRPYYCVSAGDDLCYCRCEECMGNRRLRLQALSWEYWGCQGSLQNCCSVQKCYAAGPAVCPLPGLRSREDAIYQMMATSGVSSAISDTHQGQVARLGAPGAALDQIPQGTKARSSRAHGVRR